MFSVVIPLYNKENQIKKTLESVLNQTFKDFEVVIVNDGSKDKSVEVVQSFDDPRIRLITQENAGVSAARNRGIQEAKNKWIAFLDADDLWKVDKLEQVAHAIRNNKEVIWLVTGLETIKGDYKKEFVYPKYGFLNDALDDLMEGLYIQTSSVIVNRDVFVEDPDLFFRVGVNNSEDREVWYKLIFNYPKLFYINKVLAVYIRDSGPNSLTSNATFNYLTMIERLELNLNHLPKKRQEKFKKLEFKLMRKNTINLWVKFNYNDYNNYSFLSFFDKMVMRTFQNTFKSVKLVLFKLLIRIK